MINYDVAVIGGGIQGAGIAQASAAAGFHTVLLEKHCWGGATSSSSSKLIHGGLRYLETGQIKLVFQALTERDILLKIAPDLVHPVRFVIPVYKYSQRSPLYVKLGLELYRLLALFRSHHQIGSIAPKQWTTLDGLDIDGLHSVFSYYDAQTDDQLLTKAVVRSAQDLGAEAQQNCSVDKINKTSDRYLLELSTGTSLSAHMVINASGPWTQSVASTINPACAIPAIDLVRGSHIEISQPPAKQVYYIESHIDHRAILVMPWKGRTLIGTTEQLHSSIEDPIIPSEKECDYLIQSYQRKFPSNNIKVVAKWAGLRVLPCSPDSPFRRSRDTLYFCDKQHHPNVLSVYGGKLTTYRHTGEVVKDWICKHLPPRKPIADTRKLTLSAS